MKKLLAIVISMAMLVAMMPMGVFAETPGESPSSGSIHTENGIIAAHLTDNATQNQVDYDTLNNGYSLVYNEGTITINVKGILHKNGNMVEGKWVGIAVPIHSDATSLVWNVDDGADINDDLSRKWPKDGVNYATLYWAYDKTDVQKIKYTFKKDDTEICSEELNVVVNATGDTDVAKIGNRYFDTLQAAIDAASDGDTIKLLNDITVTSIGKETKATDSKGNKITYYAIDKSITLDLNEKVLTTNQRYTTSIKGDEKKVNIINGSIRAHNLADITSALFNIKTGCELSLDNVKLSTNACALFPQGDAAKLVCKNSEISAVTYAVGTNAGTTDNYNVQIVLDHSGFSTTGADSCAVMINVKGSLKADYCRIVGGRQGLIVRAGDATVNNSKIISRTECTDVADKYYINEDGTVVNAEKWNSGNEVPQAGVVVGNYYNNSVETNEYAYLADAKLDITNTDISVGDASLVTIYLADNKLYKAIMNINGNSNVTGALIDKTGLTESGIVIKGGTFSSDPSAYVASGYYADKSGGTWTVKPVPYVPSTPPADNVTNDTTEKNTTADLTPAVKDNKAETTVDAKTADKIVDKAVENKSTEVVIDATGNNTVASSEVAIPEKTVKELAEKTDANLVIKTDNGKVDLDKTALEAVAAQAGTDGTVKLVVETVKTDENICHVDLKLVTSNGAVKDFNGGIVTVTINLTKELAAKDVVCVYINDNGIYTLVNGQKNADGTYTFTTGHFSEYAVMAKDEADKKIAEQLDTMIKDVNLKVRTSKTSKKNIKAVVSGDVKAITDAGYTVKYKFYRSEKKASKYEAKATKAGKTYINTAGKKGTKYYYKAKALVYDGDKLVGQTVLKQCKYGVRTWSK